MFRTGSAIKNLFLLLMLSTLPQTAFATQQGTVVVDTNNYWRHSGKFANPSARASYVVCNGYIGSPLIPDEHNAINTFVDNCEITPPPGSLPIIDVPENHSANYQGYPAYVANAPDSETTYFVCDGFLNSTSWCSYEAHKKAVKLLRVAESRYWEAGTRPLIIDDQPVSGFSANSKSQIQRQSQSQVQSESSRNSTVEEQELPYGEGFPKKLHKMTVKKYKLDEDAIPPGYKAVPVDPRKIEMDKLPEGAYIKKVSVNNIFDDAHESSLRVNNETQLTPTSPSVNEWKSFLKETIDQAVNRAVDKKFKELNPETY